MKGSPEVNRLHFCFIKSDKKSQIFLLDLYKPIFVRDRLKKERLSKKKEVTDFENNVSHRQKK